MADTKTVFLAVPNYRTILKEGVELLDEAGYRTIENVGTALVSPFDRGYDLREVDAVVAGLETWDDAAMRRFPKLKIIAKCGAGLDNIDLDAARNHGIVVTNTPGMNSNAVAEATVGLMLAVMRNFASAHRAVRERDRFVRVGRELAGKTVGIIGMGSIGRTVAKRLRGFDVAIRAYDPFFTLESDDSDVVVCDDLKGVISHSDIVTLHAPATAENWHMINAETLAWFKNGSYVVNTARGALVDEVALAAALESGKLAGAGLDVFEAEPVEPRNPLLALPNVVATNHLGAGTVEADRLVAVSTAESVIDVLSGKDEHTYRVV